MIENQCTAIDDIDRAIGIELDNGIIETSARFYKRERQPGGPDQITTEPNVDGGSRLGFIVTEVAVIINVEAHNQTAAQTLAFFKLRRGCRGVGGDIGAIGNSKTISGRCGAAADEHFRAKGEAINWSASRWISDNERSELPIRSLGQLQRAGAANAAAGAIHHSRAENGCAGGCEAVIEIEGNLR